MNGMGYEGIPSSDEKTRPNSGSRSNSGEGRGGAKTSGGSPLKGGYPDSTGRQEVGKAPKLKDGTTYG
jgi:hypothetical protein